jgi:hypothetical protein
MDIERFEEICRAIPYRRKGMFYSEVFLFLQACWRLGVETIVESGVKYGMSTALLRAGFVGELISIDKSGDQFPIIEGVDFMQGDSRTLLPIILKARQRVGLLIDGPKGAEALTLKDAALRWPCCKVVGVHDTPAERSQQRHTHDPSYGITRERLDRWIPEHWRRKYPMGPGLGLWEKQT